MHIILKQSSTDNDEILNIFYCRDETLIRNWILEYIQTDIQIKKEMEINQKDTIYEINDAETNKKI